MILLLKKYAFVEGNYESNDTNTRLLVKVICDYYKQHNGTPKLIYDLHYDDDPMVVIHNPDYVYNDSPDLHDCERETLTIKCYYKMANHLRNCKIIIYTDFSTGVQTYYIHIDPREIHINIYTPFDESNIDLSYRDLDAVNKATHNDYIISFHCKPSDIDDPFSKLKLRMS